MDPKRKTAARYALAAALALAAAAAMLRTLYTGLEIDEEYALSLGYRLVSGDRLFAQMWEPHQLSALTTAPLIAPMAVAAGLSAPQIALVTVTIGIGSMALSHVNDSLFWVWSRYFRVGTSEALRSYTVATTATSIVGLGVAALLWPLVAMIG